MTAPDGERIARLEQRANDSQLDRAEFERRFEQMARDIGEIKDKLSNWKGVMSGVVLTIGMLAGLIGAGLTFLWHRLFPS